MFTREARRPAAAHPPICVPSRVERRSVFLGVFGALLSVGGFALVRAVIIRSVPLTGDEAYYWEWSRHLALGYHDHPPLVAWLIAAFSVFGKSAFWVRFPSLVLSVLSGLFLFFFSRDVWGDDRMALGTLGLYLVIPIFAVAALAIFPDSPLIFGWVLFLWASWKWLGNEKYWPVMGLAAGIGALSKLMGLFLFPSLLLYLLFSRLHRDRLKGATLWESLVLALAVSSPMLYWNATHHFETFAYQADHRLVGHLVFSPSLFLNYLSLQAIALSPLVFFLIACVIAMMASRAIRGDERCAFLLSMALPIHAFFLSASFFVRVGLHWALPGYLTVLTAAPLWVSEMAGKGKRWAGPLFFASVATAFFATAFLYSLLIWPEALVPRIAALELHYRSVNHGKIINSQTLAEILGYQELGKKVDESLAGMGGEKNSFVFTDSYSLSSIIGFYADVDARTLLFTSTGGEFVRWNHFPRVLGENALYVDTQPIGSRRDIDQVLKRAFRRIAPLPPLVVRRDDLETRTFYFARCVDLVNARALEPPKPW